jgi:hypothetical protein
MAPAPITGELLEDETGLEPLQQVIQGDKELEEDIGTAYSLLNEHCRLLDVRSIGNISHTLGRRCSSIFVGNRVYTDRRRTRASVP